MKIQQCITNEETTNAYLVKSNNKQVKGWVMDGRYLTPQQLQLATVDTVFGAARTLNICSQAVLSVQSAVWGHWRRLLGGVFCSPKAAR